MSARDPIPPIWTTGTTEVYKTGTWRASLPRHIRAPAPCHVACPVNHDIPEWIGRARARDFRGAWEVLVRNNPFPAISGRVCHHPCETACNRAGYDEPLSIRKLERHIGDCAIAEGWAFAPVAVSHAEKIAVVGGGPSGLSAAFELRRRGYAVTLFEARAELGGVMRYGIPAYRLPRSILDGEIARIVALGVEARCNAPLAGADAFERLRAQYDAVYVATGAARPKRLPALDYREPQVVDGADYLAVANAGAPPLLGQRLAVVGGGSAAIDVARTARRAGHDVVILALEGAGELPAQREELSDAQDEGIELRHGTMVARATHAAAGGFVLDCVRVRFERSAQYGRFTVTTVPDSEFALQVDAIVTAIGQDPDLDLLPPALARAGSLIKVDQRQATAVPGVYAGGDVASMARFVTEAIGMGKRAAAEIERAFRARTASAAAAAAPAEAVVGLSTINTFYYERQARADVKPLEPAERLEGSVEVQRGFDPDQALAESTRCFSCGTCIDCDNCVIYCPDLAIRREAGGYVVLADYCKGCGLCVRECPTGSMKMVEERR